MDADSDLKIPRNISEKEFDEIVESLLDEKQKADDINGTVFTCLATYGVEVENYQLGNQAPGVREWPVSQPFIVIEREALVKKGQQDAYILERASELFFDDRFTLNRPFAVPGVL